MKRPNPENAPRAVRASRKCYGWLLNCYPKGHRREYGPQMSQLFCDTALDAWNQGKALGLAALWLRTVPDFFKTVVIEHLATLKGSPAMSPSTKPLKTVFLATAATVCALIYCYITATLIWLTPPQYISYAMVEIRKTNANANEQNLRAKELQTQWQMIKSPAVLNEVVSSLDLAKKSAGWISKSTLTDEKARLFLDKIVMVNPPTSDGVVGITTFSQDSRLASDIVTKIVEVYASKAQPQGYTVRFFNNGKVTTTPAGTNKPMQLVIGIPASLIGGCVTGAAMCLGLWIWRKLKAQPAVNEASPPMPG